MTKAELRCQFLAERKALTQTDVEERSTLISHRFFEFFKTTPFTITPGTIHTFLPIRRQNEVDTWLIVQSLWGRFPRIQGAVSVTDKTTNQLTHYPLYPHTELQENRWSIPEPVNPDQETAIPSHQFDLVLVPLLIFDKQGHRVGYGKGYYDRFLADCQPNCLKIGVSLFEPVERIDGLEPTDVRLNVCVTPEQTYFF